MLAVLLILLLCIWTGYGIFGLLGPRRLQSDLPAGIFAYGLVGILLTGWIALIAAEVGFFSARAVLLADVLIGTLGCWAGRYRKVRLDWKSQGIWRGEGLLIALLLVLMGILYFRPHEFIFGGADAGVYVNLGANIARTGRWLIHNPDWAVISPDVYPMFFREHPSYFIPRYNYLPGFYVSDSGAQTIIPQFYPLHPVWLAVAYGLGGIWAALHMTPLWGMLGVLAFYFAVREAFGHRLAAVAATVLALTPTQVWFARYPTAEVLTQFLLFGGLWAFARYVRQGERWAAILAGLALGEVMLARVDMYFLLGVLPVYAAYLRLQRRLDQRFWLLAIPMLALGIHSLLHAVLQGWPYLHNVYFAGRTLTYAKLAVVASGLILLVMAFLFLDRLVHRLGGVARFEPPWQILLSIAAVVLVLLAAYAYFLRPLQADPSRAASYWYGESTIPDVEPYNMVRLGWYLSRPGLALGVLGIALIVSRNVNGRTWMMVGIGVFFSLLFIYRTFNNPHHVYVMRRYVPAVIPTFALGMAYTVLYPAGWGKVGRVLAAGLTAAVVLLMPYKGQVMIPQVDYKGSVEQFRVFASLIPEDAVVLFNDDEPVGAAGVFGTPLAFLEGRTVLDLREEHLNLDRLDALVEGWQAVGRPVVVVDGSSPVSGLCDRWRCQVSSTFQFDLRVLEHSYDHWPVTVVPYRPVLTTYIVKQVH
jgi:4-amino-4-deoxy-L-arabinose transferase-like glycosyltransferase